MKIETKVGFLFLTIIALVVGFAYALGAFNPFSNHHQIELLYNYAGGIEKGSPVRVMGIKVGKVKSITFDPAMKDSEGNEVKLKIIITVSKKAWKTVKEDSKFFINLAGVIGEKFIEISPGTSSLPEMKPGIIIRGEDPPRVDQLISQSYGLAGKIIELVEKNEGSVVDGIEKINRLVTNVNRLLVTVNKSTKNKKVAKLFDDITQITGDIASVSGNLRTKEGKETINLLYRLLWRLEDLDKRAIKKFLQDEGIKAKLF